MRRFLSEVPALRVIVALLAIVLAAGLAWGHQKKAKPSAKPLPTIPLPDSEQIDKEISEMLGAWQVGNTELMHKYYADTVSVVSGAYEPPILGWQNYLAAYQEQRKRISSIELIRRNTDIFVLGDVAWAAYQWEMSAIVDAKPLSARGQTTLLFERSGARWLIVHNHTSQICEAPPTPPPPAAPTKPGD